MSQLYNISYLEQTTQVLAQLKQQSYEPFRKINTGRIADIGCGTGTDVLNLAQLLGNTVQVTGVDTAEEMIAQARSTAKQQTNADFIQATAGQLPFKDNELSGLRNERLIQHLTDAPAAFSEFYRVLSPQSPVVCVETAWSSIAFYNGDTSVGFRLRDYLGNGNVNNGAAAVKLLDYLTEAGFRAPGIEVYPFVLRSLDQVVQMLRTDHALLMMQEKGLISEEEHNSFKQALEDADRNRYFACSINLVVATAIK
ncbi:methyltransferase domain-containing protein [Taibaiella helva]|uniref:methyltransferase domain-containing protein n=1 Tax=Taibaiella helva TaxID=2301235 RepID=UPI000E58B6D5|nr:methyltransferase domain-containing protein [Taibaiella helva]